MASELERLEQAHTRSVADLYKFWDSTVTYYHTSADHSITFGGQTYAPANLSRGNTEHNINLNVSTLDIEAHYLHSSITDYLTAVLREPIWVQVIKVHLKQDPMEGQVQFIGQIARVQFIKGQVASMHCEGLEKFMRQRLPKYRYQPKCNWSLFSSYTYLKSVVGAKVFDEKFEATGYDETWSEGESVSSGCSLDPNATPPVGGWGSRCLKAVSIDDIPSAAWVWDTELGGLSRSYTRAETVIESHTMAEGEYKRLLSLYSGVGSTFMYDIGATVNSGSLKFRLDIQEDGSSWTQYWSSAISLGTKYRNEFKWDTVNDLWEWRVDDSLVASGSLTGAAASRTAVGILVGCSGNFCAMTVYHDNVAVNENGWSGADEWILGCTVSKAAYSHTISITNVLDGGLRLVGDFSTQGENYFNYGWVEWDGHKRMIVDNDNSNVYIRYPIHGLDVAACPTDGVFIAGCDKIEQTCVDKFDNHDRFLGHPNIPLTNPSLWTGN